MQIFVKISFRQNVVKTYTVSPTTSIEDLKKEIIARENINIPCNEMGLYHANRGLEDGKNLSDYNIQKEYTLHLYILPMMKLRCQVCPGKIKIFVKNLEKTFTLMMKPTDTIMVLKAKILESQGFSISQQRIIFKGKQLEDEKTMCDYGVEDKNSHGVKIFQLVQRKRENRN